MSCCFCNTVTEVLQGRRGRSYTVSSPTHEDPVPNRESGSGLPSLSTTPLATGKVERGDLPGGVLLANYDVASLPREPRTGFLATTPYAEGICVVSKGQRPNLWSSRQTFVSLHQRCYIESGKIRTRLTHLVKEASGVQTRRSRT